MDIRETSRVRSQGTKVTRTKTGADRVEACRAIVANKQYAKVDGMMIDLYSASAIVTVNDALRPENQAKFQGLSIARMAHVAFALLNKAS